jgi:hypothetical protein
MFKQRSRHKLDLKQETIRLLSKQHVALAVGGSAGGSDPSNTVSGDDCSSTVDNPSVAGHTCMKTLVVKI